MIRTIVVEDVRKNRELLKHMIQKYCPQVEVVGEAESADAGYEVIQALQPDLVLLDIEMPHGSGFDLLCKFQDIDFEVIFVTAFDQYAIKAFKFCAMDYIMKPVDIDELVAAIEKVGKKIAGQQKSENFHYLIDHLRNGGPEHHRIAVPTLYGQKFIPITDIIRCEASGKYTVFHLRQRQQLMASKNIKEFEELLSEHKFFRVHHSHMVNTEHIMEYRKGTGGYLVMSDSSSVDVSVRKRDDFLRFMNLK